MAGRGSSVYNYKELWMDLMGKNKESNGSWEDVGFNWTAQSPGIVLESSNAGDRSLSLKLFLLAPLYSGSLTSLTVSS